MLRADITSSPATTDPYTSWENSSLIWANGPSISKKQKSLLSRVIIFYAAPCAAKTSPPQEAGLLNWNNAVVWLRNAHFIAIIKRQKRRPWICLCALFSPPPLHRERKIPLRAPRAQEREENSRRQCQPRDADDIKYSNLLGRVCFGSLSQSDAVSRLKYKWTLKLQLMQTALARESLLRPICERAHEK